MHNITTTIAAVLWWGVANKLTYVFVHKNIFKGTLHKAHQEGNIKAVKQFLADGADINAKIDDTDGDTPLNCAAAVGQNEVAELLFTNGADVNTKDDFG